jgi:predicted SprT family Zn-dependent metalloprotease
MIILKPVITDIEIEPEKLEELNKIMNSFYSRNNKNVAMKRIAGGYCCVCGAIPNKLVKYKLEDITRIEYYCDKCIVRLTATNGIDETIAEKVEKNYTDHAQNHV